MNVPTSTGGPFLRALPRRVMAIGTWLGTARIRPGGRSTFMAYDPTRWWKSRIATAACCSPAIPMTPATAACPGQ